MTQTFRRRSHEAPDTDQSQSASHGSGDQRRQPRRTSSRCSRAARRSSPTPHIPHGCSLVFSPGWEADRNGGTAGLCQPVERDLFDCHMGCFWPAQVPDQLNHAPDWTAKCAAAQKDWRKIDLIFPRREEEMISTRTGLASPYAA